jgi:hypothetical protein
MNRLEIGEPAFYASMTNDSHWGLYEVIIANVGRRISFVYSRAVERTYPIETNKLFASKLEAMAEVPVDCKLFNDYTMSGLSPVEKMNLSVADRIKAAKNG